MAVVEVAIALITLPFRSPVWGLVFSIDIDVDIDIDIDIYME